ncbi:hypothetical protein JCGZ_21806 [Jatropha curcas]|uniref:Myosin motor domain-containing protein n=1 Tax=Jatropha curcas TaxID=180498 RepID=A0A067JMU9_JATCU|nr:hypothetical protein JCGZ_21806 [Jatropha curcas]
MEVTGYQLGKTKVFLRAGQMAELDAHRARVLRNSATVIQRHAKTRATRKNYVLMRQASIHIQSRWRGKLGRQQYKNMRQEAAAIQIQKNLRRQCARRSYKEVRSSAVILQAGLRAMAARGEFRFREQTNAATSIQANWRSHSAVSYYKKLKATSFASQSSWKTAGGEPTYVDMDAGESGSLLERNDQLERQVEELTCHLQSEKQLRIELEETKGREIKTLLHSLKNLQNQVDETNTILLQEREEREAAHKENGARPLTTEALVLDDDDGTLGPDMQNLKALLRAEKQRADDSERRCAEAVELSEKRRKKLEETERRVHQLQDSMNRMLNSMADQFSELKMILQTSSNSTSTSGSIAINVRVDVASDTSDNESDFSFQHPTSSSPSDEFSAPDDSTFQLIVQDLSQTENSGSGKSKGDKKGAFDDFF